jgi:LuxR family maltose regulon positive regulatory protein
LSDAELSVLRLLRSQLSQREIAGELHLSFNTIKTHTRNIYRKLDVAERRDAVARARELSLI